MDSTRRDYRAQTGESTFSKLFHPKVEKVQPASGLSRPRLVKVRRQFPSSRVRPGLEDPLGPGTYPDASSEQSSNRGFTAASVNVDRNAGGLNPRTAEGENFASLTGQASNSHERNRGRAETAFSADFFVFGNSSDQSMASDRRKFGGIAAENLPEEFQRLNVNYSGTAEKPQKSNNSAFVFNSTKTASESIGVDTYAPGSFSFRNSSMGRSIPDLNSSFRSSGEKLPHYLSQLDINDSSLKNKPGDTRKTIPSVGIFDFQATSTHTSDKENLDSVLPGEMRKLKIEVPEKDSGSNKTEGSYSSSQAEGVQSFVFGSKNGISIQERKAVNPFEKYKDPDKKADDGFDESSTRKLPEEIQRLKIRDPENDDTAGSSSRDFFFSSSKSASGSFCEENSRESFMFGVNKGMEAVNSPKKTAEQFAFRKPSAKNSVYDQRSNDGFNASVAEKLPEEIQKLKIKDPENDNNAGKTSTGGSFVFISSQSVSSSSIKDTPTDKFMFGSKGKGFDPDSSEFVVSSSGFESCTTANGNISGSDNASTAAVDNENSSSKTEGSDYVSACSSFTSDGGKCFSSQSGENYSSTGFVFGKSSQESKFHDHNELQELHGADTPSSKVVDRASESFLDNGGTFVRNSSKSNFFAFGSDFSFGNTTSVDPSSQSWNHNTNAVKPNIEENVRPISVSWRGQQENDSKREDTILGTYDSASFLNSTSNEKKGVSSHVRARKRRGKLKESLSFSQRNNAGASLREKISQVQPNLDSQGDYSPMDFSPCFAEGQISEEYSREASVASEESITADSTHILKNINTSFSAKGSAEDLADVAVKLSSLESSEQANANSGFTFAASSSAQSSFSSSKHSHIRKFRSKVGQNDFVSISDQDVHLFPNLKESSHLDGKKAQTEVHKKEAETNKASHCKEHISMSASATTAQENCEKWRLRGNQAYSTGDLCKAEDYYTRGVKSVSPAETSLSCRRTLMLCYSNRAAARMSNGRIREALSDCMMATGIDPGFLRAQLRAASCHLQLGETEEACNHFKKCLHGGCDSSRDQKFILEASDGLQKVKVVADCMEKASSLLQKGTINDAITVLQITSDALSLSPYAEGLIEMKAEALLLLRRYEELILLLDQTLESAEKNSSTLCNKDQEEDNDYSRSTSSRSLLWRVYIKSRAFFYLGKLEEALSLMKDNGQVKAVTERDKSDSWALLSTTVSELLRLKVAGNTAFNSGKHSDAVEHYTAALTYNIESCPFTAVCFCNRAAAYQALGQITEAISDCSLAIALDPNYRKAISRRATLHEMIRDYSQAANDMRRLISLMEKNNADKIGSGRHTNNGDDLDSARLRLTNNEDKSRKEIPLDMYKILGVEASSDVAEIKKAYRKAALRHHPDKASQLLVRSENTDEKVWKEVADEVHRDADRLFKMIGEAYAILSDPTKRQAYDINEEIRILKERSHVSGTSTTQPSHHYYRNNSSYYERESDTWPRPYDNSGPRYSRSYRTGRYY